MGTQWDPKTEKGPNGDPGLKMGTHLEAVGYRDTLVMMRTPGWLLCCSGQFRCNGAWNKAAAGKIRYSSSSFLTENLENMSVKISYGSHGRVLKRGRLCIKLIGVLLSVQAELQFHFRRENNSQSKAKPFHTLSNTYTIVFVPEVNKKIVWMC